MWEMDVVLESSTATQDETAQAFLRRCGKNLKEWKEGWRFLARREDGPECSLAERIKYNLPSRICPVI